MDWEWDMPHVMGYFFFPPNLPVSLKGPRKKEVDILLKLEFPYKAPDFGASNNNCAPAIREVKRVLVQGSLDSLSSGRGFVPL